MKKFLFAFRKFFSIFVAIFSYVFFVYSFFFLEYWLMGTVFLFLFFVSFRFLFIELKLYGAGYFVGIFLISSLMISFFLGYQDLFKITSVFLSHVGICFLVLSIDNEINNRKKISVWGIFTVGTGLFTVFVALTYSTLFISKYDEFNLTCEDIEKNMDVFIDTVSKPMQISAQEAQKFKDITSGFYDTEVRDFLGLPDTEKLNGLTGGIQDIQHIDNEQIDLEQTDQMYTEYEGGVFGKIDKWKNQFVDNILKDKETVDQGVCEVLIQQINKRYDSPGFKFSVIFLLFLLLWPSFRIMFFVIGIITFLFFKLLQLIKIYRFELQIDEVEQIK